MSPSNETHNGLELMQLFTSDKMVLYSSSHKTRSFTTGFNHNFYNPIVVASSWCTEAPIKLDEQKSVSFIFSS